jgi:hypothetical protein
MLPIAPGSFGGPSKRQWQRRCRREKTWQPSRYIFGVIQNVVDDLAQHHDPEENCQILVVIDRPKTIIDAFLAQRDRGHRSKRKPCDTLTVQPNLRETTVITSRWRSSLFQFLQSLQVFIDP